MPYRRAVVIVAVIIAAIAAGAALDRYGWPIARLQLFRMFPATGAVVMVGDSLTEYADWAALLGRTDVVNRGIVGDTSAALLARLDTVTTTRADVAFVMIGINDLQRAEPPANVAASVTMVVDRLSAARMRVILQSTLRTSGDDALNDSVDRLNADLSSTCQSGRCTFVDLNALLAPDGPLIADYTVDGLHLSPAGYRRWAGAIAGLLPR